MIITAAPAPVNEVTVRQTRTMLITRRTALSQISAGTLALACAEVPAAGGADFSRWPWGKSPKDIGNLLANL